MANPTPIQFVRFCAVWNFLVGTIQSIPELGSLLTGYVTDPWEARAFDDAISKISLDLIKEELKKSHGFGEGQEGWDKYRLNYQATQDVLFVASFFVGAGEIKSLATTGKMGELATLTEKVDNVITTIGKSADEISVISRALRRSPPRPRLQRGWALTSICNADTNDKHPTYCRKFAARASILDETKGRP